MGIRRKIIILFKIVNDVLFYSLLKVFSLSARVAKMKMHSRLSGGWLDVMCLFLSRIHSKGSFNLCLSLNLCVIPSLKLVVNVKIFKGNTQQLWIYIGVLTCKLGCEVWHQKFDKGLEILWWWIFSMSRRTPWMFLWINLAMEWALRRSFSEAMNNTFCIWWFRWWG